MIGSVWLSLDQVSILEPDSVVLTLAISEFGAWLSPSQIMWIASWGEVVVQNEASGLASWRKGSGQVRKNDEH
jgi:hypothetical protein